VHSLETSAPILATANEQEGVGRATFQPFQSMCTPSIDADERVGGGGEDITNASPPSWGIRGCRSWLRCCMPFHESFLCIHHK